MDVIDPDVMKNITDGCGDGTITMAEVGKLLMMLIEQVKNLTENIKRKDEEINEKDTKINQLEKRIKDQEIKQCRNNIIIREVPPIKKASQEGRNETVKETRSIVDNILADLKVDVMGWYGAKRYRKKEGSRKEPIIHVKFWTEAGRKWFYEGLARNKARSNNATVKRMKIADEIPHFLLNDYIQMEKLAAEFRKKNRAAKTRTRIVDQEVVLFGRKENETDFRRI